MIGPASGRDSLRRRGTGPSTGLGWTDARARVRVLALCWAAWVGLSSIAVAHDGPPYPILSDRAVGPYTVSVWTDPDTTDDGSAGGQFWVVLARRDDAGPVPPDTRATIVTEPLDRPGSPRSAVTEPVRNDPSNQVGAVVFDHEGRFRVRVDVRGSMGGGRVESEVDATYDLRPAPALLLLYLMPFVAVGLLWAKLLLRRRSAVRGFQGIGDRV